MQSSEKTQKPTIDPRLQDQLDLETKALKQGISPELITENRADRFRNLAIQELEINDIPVNETTITEAIKDIQTHFDAIRG